MRPIRTIRSPSAPNSSSCSEAHLLTNSSHEPQSPLTRPGDLRAIRELGVLSEAPSLFRRLSMRIGRKRWVKPVTAMTAVALSCGGALGDERDDQRDKEISELKAQVAELKAKDEGSWLTQRRAEEIKSL